MKLRTILRLFLAVAMSLIGLLHFANPEPFVRIVPSALPYPLMLVYLSGAFEIAGGVGLLFTKTRLWAAYGLIALYLAVLPANINMAVNEIQLSPDGNLPVWAMWARLPLQALFIATAWWVRKDES